MKYRNAVIKYGSAAAGSVVGFALEAHAALPTAASDAMTAMTTDAGTIMTWVWGLGTTVSVGFIMFKLFKKGGNKAT